MIDLNNTDDGEIVVGLVFVYLFHQLFSSYYETWQSKSKENNRRTRSFSSKIKPFFVRDIRVDWIELIKMLAINIWPRWIQVRTTYLPMSLFSLLLDTEREGGREREGGKQTEKS